MKKLSKKQIVYLAIIAAVILAAAIVGEIIYVQTVNPFDESHFPQKSVEAADFSAVEFEDKGSGQYYALAYNSYFEYDGFGSVPAQNIRVTLSRIIEDTTESVVYFKGTVDGVYGEYISPLVRESDTDYVAMLGADSIDSIKIFPTEEVRSTIIFGGAVLNYEFLSESFSAARVILWVFCLLSLYVLYILVRSKIKKSQQKPNAWLCTYVLLQALVMLAAFQASKMFTAVSGLDELLIAAAFVLFSVLYALIYIIAVKIKISAMKLAACVAIVGSVFVISVAPLQAPDEYTHYLRAYSISCGQLDFDNDYDYPNDVDLLIECFPGSFYQEVQQRSSSDVLSRFSEYFDRVGSEANEEWSKTAIQLIVPYVPTAAGIAVARLLGANALISYYAGRLMNLIMLVVCSYFAMKWASRYRGAIILTALFPLSLFMCTSFSYDAMFICALVLMLGLLFKSEVGVRELAGICLSFSAIVAIKPIYFPLALLIFTIPKERFNFKKINRLCAVVLVAFSGAAIYMLTMLYAQIFAHSIPSQIPPEGVNVSAQIAYILGNPVRYGLMAVIDGYMNGFYTNVLGLFGWLDINAVLSCVIIPIVVVVVAMLYADDTAKRKKSDVWIFTFVTLLIYAIVVTGFYCTWSTLGSTSILGVQARYFIPILPCIAAVISRLFSHCVRFKSPNKSEPQTARDTLCIYICSSSALIASCEIALLYYFT